LTDSTLVRRIGLVGATSIVVSNMIGIGIFTMPAFFAGDLGTPPLVIGIWVVGAFMALVGALCYSELSINFPRSGGEYVYLSEAWGPTWGFVDGWVTFFAGFSAPIAVAALAISAYLAYFFPALSPDYAVEPVLSLGFVTIQLGGAQLVACGVVIVFTLLNILNVSQVSKLQNYLTGAKLLVLLTFLVLGFAVGDGDWSHFSREMTRTSELSLGSQFAVSLVFIYLGYSGWNAAVYVAEEIRDPVRVLPRALLGGTLVVALFFIALNCLYIYANPLEKIAGNLAVGANASKALFGPQTAGLFAAAMAASLLATVNAMCLIGPRVYYAMAQNRAFLPAAAKVHPRWQSPWVAVIAQGTCCCLLIVTGTFESLAYYISFMLNLFSALAVVALLKFRRGPNWQQIPWVSFAYPLIPGIYVGVNFLIFIYFASNQVEEAIWALLTVFAGALVFHFGMRRSGAASDGPG
jgi:APA family basic amino acid/polyamine antiporter